MTIFKPENRAKNYPTIYFYAIQRKYIWNYLAKKNNSFLVSEYPKSGGTWYAQMLSEYFELPFPRNYSKPIFTRSVIHGHQKYKKYNEQMSTVIRDGRDVMISFYHHFLMSNDWNHHSAVNKNIVRLGISDVDNIEKNLPTFIEYISTAWAKKGHFTWQEFVLQWCENLPPERIIRYEDLLDNPHETMRVAIKSLAPEEMIDNNKITRIIEKNSFKNISGRAHGKEKKSSFARKGIKGDWKNHFNNESIDIFNKYNQEAMKLLGYY